VGVTELQKKIEEYLGLNRNTLLFEYNQVNGKIQLNLITVNPRHNQSFLYHSLQGHDKLDALTKMYKYVTTLKEKENHYSIQWRANEENDLHTSYFRAINIYDALDKLYYGRDIHSITVFHVTLNPMT
jgi:hypothetical protein